MEHPFVGSAHGRVLVQLNHMAEYQKWWPALFKIAQAKRGGKGGQAASIVNDDVQEG